MMRRSLLDLESLRGIDHVVRREPVVEPARFGAQSLSFEGLCDSGRERNYVVFDLGLDLLNPGGRHTGMFGDGLGSGGGNDAVFCQNRACSRLHLQPAAVLVVFGPDAAHCRAGVAINHWSTPGIQPWRELSAWPHSSGRRQLLIVRG